MFWFLFLTALFFAFSCGFLIGVLGTIGRTRIEHDVEMYDLGRSES